MAICESCGKDFVERKSSKGKYCSHQCQADMRSMAVVNTWLEDPSPKTFYSSNNVRPGIRRFLIKKSGCKCSRCGWGEKHISAALPSLEIEHIDGNWLNCSPSNIDIICPNCHSLTDTYKARNRGNGRDYRRIERE